jgi:GNAT superfamily N-acetyltransferase
MKFSASIHAMYRIREADGYDEQVADILAELHQLTFLDAAKMPDFEGGVWWIACHGRRPVAFAGLVSSTHMRSAGYLCRVGVIEQHRGHGLQLRLTRAIESRARRNGWTRIVSDTTDNLASANNFIRAGYRLYRPQMPWAWPGTLYWQKSIGCPDRATEVGEP